MALFVSADNVVIRVIGAVGMGVTMRVCLSEDSSLSYTKRPRADFVLTYLENLISQEEHRIFHTKTSKSRNIYFFRPISYLNHLRAFSLQTQQGHFHPWPF